jgi:SAM-dependent methyltransferase
MPEIDLLGSSPKVIRDIRGRRLEKERNRKLALKFGREYFDGTRAEGYGGYVYDGRWQAVAQRLVARYGLAAGDRVLDIGCAKGFLVKDLHEAAPGLSVFGLDVSSYALREAHQDARPYLIRGSCDKLPFADNSFKLALAINTIHNLEPDGCRRALREIQRVSPDNAFVQVDAYRSESERQLFEDWMLTARTYLDPSGWASMFEETGYTGDYYWTILEHDEWIAR